MSGLQLCYLLLAGAAATGGQFFITAAYRQAPAKEIAVFDYAQVLFAAILGFCFLSQVPGVLSIIGYVVIIGAAVGNWAYRLKRSKKETKPQATAAEAPPEQTDPLPEEETDEKSRDENGS